MDVSRRQFLKTPLIGAAALGLPAAPLGTPAAPDLLAPLGEAVDVNVYLEQWPFRRVPGDETEAMLRHLRRFQVRQAWAGSLDALLHKDVGAVNIRLAEQCRTHGDGVLLPFGCVNPLLPDWEEDVRRCHEELKMPGLRVHPDYHGYRLDDPVFARLLDLVQERDLILQMPAVMEDPRTQHPLVQAAPVDLEPLPRLLAAYPRVRLVLLNALRSAPPPLIRSLAESGQVYFEISWLEGAGGVGRLLETFPLERLLFGSYSPVFYFESAFLKLKESPLNASQTEAILRGNATRLLKGAGRSA